MKFEIEALSLPDVRLLKPHRFGDARGYFAETYNRRDLAASGIVYDFIQDNESLSRAPWTLRGLHYQAPPHAQAKLVRVLAGAILDVVVDARPASPGFGQWASVRLCAATGWQLLVPEGFLHGFLTLEPDTRIAYKVNAHYDRDSDGAVTWNDRDLAIDWGLGDRQPVVSDKDGAAPAWRDWTSPF